MLCKLNISQWYYLSFIQDKYDIQEKQRQRKAWRIPLPKHLTW